MKDTTRGHRKMVLLALASAALFAQSAHAGTVSAQQEDLILGFRAAGGTGAGVNLEVDLGSVSNFYNGSVSMLNLSSLVTQDLINTYGANWGSRTDLFWGAAATDGNAQADPNGKPASTLWATGVPINAAPLEGSSGLQSPAATKIDGMYSGSLGSLDGAISTTNSSEAADINNSQTGSWSVQETSGNSFGFFSPKIDGQVSSVGTLNLYELQPSTTFPRPPGTFLGTLILTQSGLSFHVADPFAAWQVQYFGSTTSSEGAAGADLLGKGISNTNQFLLGLNPTNPASVFGITSIVRTPTNVTVAWKTAGVRTNVLQGATGTTNGSYSNNFTDISGGIVIGVVGDTSTNFVDHSGTNRYFRVRLGP
jgi:hypothetical protein